MKLHVERLILLIFTVLLMSGCNGDTLFPNYSGTYCISAHDHILQINQAGFSVNFTLTADTLTLTGSGTVFGTQMTLHTVVEGQEMVLTLVFAGDGNSFTGEYTLAGNTTSPYNGTKGACPDNYPTEEISLISPYVNYADMASIQKGFGCNVVSPWQDHSGLDIVPAGNLMPFRAMAAGKVVEVNATRNQGNNLWMTSVIVKYNSTYRILYAFENLTPDEADRDIQLANLSVTPGQMVTQGEILGRLHTVPSTYYHVHISLIKNGERICPDPYFTADARTGINNLIHVNYPALQMCYDCD